MTTLNFSGTEMDGVLEATISLCGCKLLCSILCLPAFKDFLSSVSLCCSCLLLFTDLSITVFLAYLWSAAPRPVYFHPSSDVIALRFILFLGNTYGTVLMLTPLLVAVEVLIRFLWRQKAAVMENVNGETAKANKEGQLGPTVLMMDENRDAWEMEPLAKAKKEGIFFKFLKAVGFLGCLILWGMSGTYAESIWRQDQRLVRECLDRGGSLSACLPCLLTTSSPVRGQLSWVLIGILLLLGLTGSLGLLVPKLAQVPLLISQTNQLHMSRNRGAASAVHLKTLCKWVRDYRSRKYRSTLDYNSNVDSNIKNSSCMAQSSQFGHTERQWAHAKMGTLSGHTGLACSCKLQSRSILPILLPQTELPLKGTKTVKSKGEALPPNMRLWKPQRESPCLKEDLMTGLVCGLLLCAFPTVLSINVLLVRNLDALAVYAVKHLLISGHSK